MKTKVLTIILIAAITVGVFFLVSGLWSVETKATQSLEEKALLAAEQGNWEMAYVYAEEADKSGSSETLSEIGYRNAETALSNGDYLSAQQQFETLGAYRDAQERARECRYLIAEALEAAGDDLATRDAFFAMIPYSDTLDRYRACCYRIAEQELAAGNSREAFLAFYELASYKDAEARAVAIAKELTGETDPDRAVAYAKGFSGEQWEQMEALGNARENLRMNCIAAGKAHVVLLFQGGHVEAFGDNSSGQCSVGSFQDITAVAAGYQHTLGLRADGTVVAAGDNSCGQCDVDSWTDVVSIACGAWDSYGIRSDGSLLHCGFTDIDLAGWNELVAVRASEISVIGLRRDGTILCTSDRGRFTGGDYCGIEIAISSAYGLKEDGTVQANDPEIAKWENIIALECSTTVLTGICSDGTLTVKALLPVSSAFLEQLRNERTVAAIACAGTFAVILHEDGSVSACGDLPADAAGILSFSPTI